MFVLIFIFMAPALVFYTAGYRWNSKKGVVERNGTMIFDSMPRAAGIYLNDQKINEQTPATLQNVAPGNYSIKYSLDGYHDWQKNLSVEPERVTFANTVHLWQKTDPQLIADAETDFTISNPNQDYIIYQFNKDDASYIGLLNSKSTVIDTIKLEEKLDPVYYDWSADGEKVFLISQTDGTRTKWLIQTSPLQVVGLNGGNYHWERSQLMGYGENDIINIASGGAVSRKPNPDRIHDQINNNLLKYIENGSKLILQTGSASEEGIVLPSGNWQFRYDDNNEILLQDDNRWLRISLTGEAYSSIRANGQFLSKIEIKREIYYLLLNYNELFYWEPANEPELLYRQSEPIIAAGWHPDGMDVFMATQNEIFMIELDERNGRHITKLAEFDSIYGAAIADDEIIISGIRGNESGLWSLRITE